MQQLAAACANKVIIRPSKGYIIEFHSKYISEPEMNAICAKAVYMEVCITISASNYKRFRCPHLRELRPCAPGRTSQPWPLFQEIYSFFHLGRAAITVIDNKYLVEFFIPIQTLTYPTGVIIIELSGNPLLPFELIAMFKKYCKGGCRFPNTDGVIAHYVKTNSSRKWCFQLVSCNPGSTRTKNWSPPVPESRSSSRQQDSFWPSHRRKWRKMRWTHSAPKLSIWRSASPSQVHSSRGWDVRSCRSWDRAAQVRLEHCLVILTSYPTMLLIPGQPAITITNNLPFNEVQIPPSIKYPQRFPIFQVSGNPRLPSRMIDTLKRICPHCRITADYGLFTENLLLLFFRIPSLECKGPRGRTTAN